MSLSLSGRLGLSVNSARYDQIVSPKEKGKRAMIQVQIKTHDWFNDSEDRTMIGDYHRIENQIIGWRKIDLVKKDSVKFLGEFDFDRMIDSVNYSIVRKLKSIMQDREQLKATLIEEAKINSSLFDEYMAGKRSAESLMSMYEKSIKLCPVSNALDILEIRYLEF